MTGTAPGSAPAPLSAADERLWASLAHFGNIIGFLPSLLILLILGPRSAVVRQESRKALNFVITAAIAYVALLVVGQIFGALYQATPAGLDVVFSLLGLLVSLVMFAVWVVVVIFSIIAGLRVNRGGTYRYPFALRLVK